MRSRHTIRVGGLMSVNTFAIPAAKVPGPLVTQCRSRTVVKVGLIGWCAGGSSARPIVIEEKASSRLRWSVTFAVALVHLEV